MERLSEHQMECMIATMLKVGVSLAAALVVAGSLLLLHQGHGGLIQFGLLVLIATPVARVAFCAGGFLRQRNGLYVAISSVVLMVLLYSLTKGAH